MQKHRRSKKGSKHRIGWNANTELTTAAVSSIENLAVKLELSIDSCSEQDVFSCNYLREQYLSKYCDESLTPSGERRLNAINKWKSQESLNKETNYRLIFAKKNDILPGLNQVTLGQFLHKTRRIINQVLGSLHDSIVVGSFSGGASTGRKRGSSSPAEKLVGQADLTSEAVDILYTVYKEIPLFREYGTFVDRRIVEGAVLFTVPKKTDIDRCACKEPEINMFLQKGVGNYIRKRLRKFGIDLNDQSRNRDLARAGSRNRELATLDLSSASDSISVETVRALLPDLWFQYLDSIRSHQVKVDETWVRTEMFSSMGNGFTFELESLIFYALTRAACYFENISGIISIYGDDIICPSACAPALIELFGYFGFRINTDKSFHDETPFRESCGGHYYNGFDVTPFYLKRRPERLTDLIRVANQFRSWLLTDDREIVIGNGYELWHELAQHVPKVLWGGCDYALDTQLVSYRRSSSMRLVRMQKEKPTPEVGKYLEWHNSSWKRQEGPSDDGFPPVVTQNACRLRRGNTSMYSRPIPFLNEIV